MRQGVSRYNLIGYSVVFVRVVFLEVRQKLYGTFYNPLVYAYDYESPLDI